MIPAGFRLASGWLATGLGTCWGWGHPNPDARVIGPFISDDGECLCADHAIKRGALVAVAPVVEAPLVSESDLRWAATVDELQAQCDGLRAALAAAEQRAANLEERWGEAASRAELAEQRADRADDKLRRIGGVLKTAGCDCDCEHHRDECSDECQRCTGCLIDTILRGGM